MTFSIKINGLTPVYCTQISEAFAAQGWNKPAELYLKYLLESRNRTRTMLTAEFEDEFAGYVTIVWHSDYRAFREAGVPEIVDFNVLKKFQRQGCGTLLLDEAERLIKERSEKAGLGVGLYPAYGPAQIMYVKRGYVPDGRGICQGGQPLDYGQTALVNDDLVLYFIKELS